LIKVVTNQKGFVWEGGILGITKVEKKTGEYWVYVPRGSKKITIKHEDLGVLRNYIYPEAIKEATVYEMKLTTGEVKTVVEEKELAAQWLIIQTEPEDANVFIDDKLAGTTPFQRKYEEGEYTYRIEKSRYHNKAGKVTLKDEKKRLDFTLEPRFGNIKVTSAPENGMMIYLDDENTGKKTPATLEEVSSGEHTIKLQSQWYQPQSKKITVEDAQTATVNFELEKAYANITVQTQPSSNILIDGEKKGNGNWQGRLMEGIYTIKAEEDKYHSHSEQLKVTTGEEESVTFDLEGKTGNADIVTTPMDAQVYLDGEKQGTSPLTLKDLLIGEHKLEIRKEGYGTIKKTLTVKEEESLTIKDTLPESKKITITSQPPGAELYIDYEYVGTTPYNTELGFGNRKIKIVNGEITKQKTINITKEGRIKWEFEVHGEKGTFIDDRDGKTYKWVHIGEQIWMAENLNYKISWLKEKGEDWCYDKKAQNCDSYGRLYNWEAVMQGESSSNKNPSGVQGICPDGWHFPSKKEWQELANYIKNDTTSRNEGKALKATNGWSKNGNGTDDFGFEALPAGKRDFNGAFGYKGEIVYWWSSTSASTNIAWGTYLDSDNNSLGHGKDDKNYGFSVRCVKD